MALSPDSELTRSFRRGYHTFTRVGVSESPIFRITIFRTSHATANFTKQATKV